jgi:hypothetical protein
MKRILLIAALGTASAYSAQSTTTVSTTTTVNTATNATATTTAVPATFAFIYAHLIQNGVGAEDATQQAMEWHAPMAIPFTNPEQEGEQPVDNPE